MRRFADVFIFLCILAVAVSLGVVLRIQFDASIVGTVLSTAALVGVLYLINRETSRRRARDELAIEIERIGSYLQRLSEDVISLERRVTAADQTLPRRTREEIEPLAAEVEVMGGLVKQVVETVADMEMRVGELAARATATAYAPPPAAPPAYVRPPVAPAPQAVVPPAAPMPAAAPAMAAPGLAASGGIMPQGAPQPALQTAPLTGAPAWAASSAMFPTEATVRPAVQPAAPPVVQPPRARESLVPQRFGHLDERGFADLLKRALEASRIDVNLQPIVTLPQRKVRFYEALTRLRSDDGETIYPADYLPIAEQTGLVAALDNQILLRSVQILRRLSQRTREIGIFVNLSTVSLADPSFFRDFIGFLDQNRNLADMLIFEFPQASARAMGPIEFEALKAIYDLGFRFSLDQITDLKISFQNLFERGFRYAKITTDRLLNRADELGTDIHPADLSSYFQRFGIDLIADHVESEPQVVDMLDYSIRYGQGILFSPPRPVRAEPASASEPAARPEPARESAPRAASGRDDIGRGEAARGEGTRAGKAGPGPGTAPTLTPSRRPAGAGGGR